MDIELYYREAGSGEPLIMLHGNGESGEYFINQIEHFQSRYRVIAPDTRGHGRSPRGEAPFTIAQFANDLYDFMQRLGIARAAILGFSDGANIAMKFAMQHPEMVKALILNGGEGLVKIIADAKYGEVLGMHIIGPRATDLIAEGALAIRLEATIDELISTIHSHPTVTETMRECALDALGRAVHIPPRRK